MTVTGSFIYDVAKIWNNIPPLLQMQPSVRTFKNKMKESVLRLQLRLNMSMFFILF